MELPKARYLLTYIASLLKESLRDPCTLERHLSHRLVGALRGLVSDPLPGSLYDGNAKMVTEVVESLVTGSTTPKHDPSSPTA